MTRLATSVSAFLIACTATAPSEPIGTSSAAARTIDEESPPECFAGRPDYRAICATGRDIEGHPVGDRYAFDSVCLSKGGVPFLSTGPRRLYIDGCGGLGVFGGVQIICCGEGAR